MAALSAGRQALLTLAHLRNGQPYAQLAASFGIGTTTVYRYVTEAVDLLAVLAPTLAEAVRAASMKAYLILDGTLLPIDGAGAPTHSRGVGAPGEAGPTEEGSSLRPVLPMSRFLLGARLIGLSSEHFRDAMRPYDCRISN